MTSATTVTTTTKLTAASSTTITASTTPKNSEIFIVSQYCEPPWLTQAKHSHYPADIKTPPNKPTTVNIFKYKLNPKSVLRDF